MHLTLAAEPLSLFHPKRKRVVKAIEERSKRTSAAAKNTKELSPYTATLERFLQQRDYCVTDYHIILLIEFTHMSSNVYRFSGKINLLSLVPYVMCCFNVAC
jgi:hypothetical protein